MIKNPIPWPNNARCAACVTFDIDSESLIHLEHPADGYRRYGGLSMLQYGPVVGVPRILDTYRNLGIKQTFFIPAWCIEHFPDTVKAIVKDGHEVAQHGYLHENPLEASREENLYWLKRCIKIIENASGQRPRGYRAPLYNFNADLAEMLMDEGFTYDASLQGDDIPYVLRMDKGDLIEIPAHWGVDDWPQYVQSFDLNYMMPIKAASLGMDVFREEFEAAYKYRGMWLGVWHPFATGRLSRWDKAEEMLDYMKGKGDVWFATMEEIAAHVHKVIADGTYKPRVDNLPYYTGPVPRIVCGAGI